MLSVAPSIALLLLPSALASLSGAESGYPRLSRANDPCDDVHIFLARGNNEPYPGRQSRLVMALCDGLSSCGYEDLVYSALYTDLYCQTVYDGTIAGFTQMSAYANRCPKSKLILGGYSQGGQIATDILGGGGGTLFNDCIQPTTPALDRESSPGNKREYLAFMNTYQRNTRLTCPFPQLPPSLFLATRATQPRSPTTSAPAPTVTAHFHDRRPSCWPSMYGRPCCGIGAHGRIPSALATIRILN